MKSIFDDLSGRVSKMTTSTYSTSFSLGILLLKKKFRAPIYGIYGFVRFADEIVDSFHEYNKVELLNNFKRETVKSIDHGISLNPILNSFQKTVHEYQIDMELIDLFMNSMEMDLENIKYDRVSYENYILGSAEAVGLMCLRVFTEGNNALYEKLKPSAMALGAAFQKVNFLRDAQDDFSELGRTYFPDLNFQEFSLNDKKAIELEIEEDFKAALIGIKKLPKSARSGVYLAYIYYLRLFMKIKRVPVERIMVERIRIPNGEKLSIMFNSMIRHQLNLL